MRTLSLTRSLSVTLDGSGAGTVQLGPTMPGEIWNLTQASVICSATVTTGTCEAKIYIGPGTGQPRFVDGTFSGDSGDTTDAVTGRPIYPGNSIFAVFSGGVAGATATLTISGTRQVP